MGPARKIVTATAVVVLGPASGIVAGFLLAFLAMTPAWLRGNDAPGGGFVPIIGAALGLLASLVPTMIFALRILLRSSDSDSYQGATSAAPLTPGKEGGFSR